jgi:multidrug transporter EmrE-like cation transporter
MSLTDITLLSLFEIVGDFGFKTVALTGSFNGWFAGISGYTGIVYSLIKSLKVKNVVYVNGMWDGMSALLETLVAIFIFGERLDSPIQYVGMVFIILGLFFLRKPIN